MTVGLAKPAIVNADDLIRDAILRHLCEVHRSARGPKKVAIGILDLRRAMKSNYGYGQTEVVGNLDYLVQKGWVTEVITSRSFQTSRGTFHNAEQTKYKISSIGLDRMQKASIYQRQEKSGVNITNVHGVTVVGDGNVVNTHFTDLSRVLSEMRSSVQSSRQLGDAAKLSTLADLDTLQAQLQKPDPNKTVITALWAGIEKAASIAGLIDLCERTATLIRPLLS